MAANPIPYSSTELINEAKTRWLIGVELASFLDPKTTPLSLSTQLPLAPPKSGTLMLFDRSITRSYKNDGHVYVKKRNSTKVREDHVKLLVNDKLKVGGTYVHSVENKTFHRRAYRLIDITRGGTGSKQNTDQLQEDKGDANVRVNPNLILLHYLDTKNIDTTRAQKINIVTDKRRMGIKNSSGSILDSNKSRMLKIQKTQQALLRIKTLSKHRQLKPSTHNENMENPTISVCTNDTGLSNKLFKESCEQSDALQCHEWNRKEFRLASPDTYSRVDQSHFHVNKTTMITDGEIDSQFMNSVNDGEYLDILWNIFMEEDCGSDDLLEAYTFLKERDVIGELDNC